MGLEFIDLSNLISTASKLALKMDDDDAIGTLSPELDEESIFMQTLVRSLPYDCESVEEMREKLEFIVGKITICVKSKNWRLLTAWDDVLTWLVPFCFLLREI
jgi:proteasome activator subunit 4